MQRIEKIIVAVCSTGVAMSFLVLIAAVLTQVLGRTLGSSPVWTEELTRFAMLYTVTFGAGLSLRSGDLVNVDVVCESLPGTWPRRLRLLSAVATFALCTFLIAPAWKYVSIGALQTSPALGVRMDYIHFSVFALLIGIALFALMRILAMVFHADQGQPENQLEI
ncbi:TRAP transporter small permease [Aliiroseovarius crassostreae]|uniref:TRAP transporter small permease n=1 Tax=Aliiroseovarius crassostreae TaxID=154981 RepID=UPI003C7B4D69